MKKIFYLVCSFALLIIFSACTHEPSQTEKCSLRVFNSCDETINISVYVCSENNALLGAPISKAIPPNWYCDFYANLYEKNYFWVSREGENTGWRIDREYKTVILENNNESKTLKISKYKGIENKIENTEESNVYPLKIINSYGSPLVVCLGNVPVKTEGGYNWDKGEYYSFMDQAVFFSNDTATLYGNLSDDDAFYIHGWPIIGNGYGWGVTKDFNEVIFRKANGKLIINKYKASGEKVEFPFSIESFCSDTVTVSVGDVPKYGNEYNLNEKNLCSVIESYELHNSYIFGLKLSESLYENYTYLVNAKLPDGQNESWIIDKNYKKSILSNSGKDKKLCLSMVKNQVIKYENTSEPDIYSLKIRNETSEPVILCLGEVPLIYDENNNVIGYEEKNADVCSFIDSYLLYTPELLLTDRGLIQAYGKLSENQAFYLKIKTLDGQCKTWVINKEDFNSVKVFLINDELAINKTKY